MEENLPKGLLCIEIKNKIKVITGLKSFTVRGKVSGKRTSELLPF